MWCRQVSLPAVTYWLAYLPSSNSLAFKTTSTGSARYYGYTYGPLPGTFSTSPQSGVTRGRSMLRYSEGTG